MNGAERQAAADDGDGLFIEDADIPAVRDRAAPWKMLIVDDDEGMHVVTRLALADQVFLGRPVQLLGAYSAAEALSVLAREPDVAILLLDVVMETDDAGLMLVRQVRQDLGNALIRIVLRTGQPGIAPELQVIRDYDINDYRAKTELTQERLITTITTALRNYRDLVAAEANRRGLRRIIEATASLYQSRSLPLFAEGVLVQMAGLLGARVGGVLCCPSPGGRPRILGATGRFAPFALAAAPEADLPAGDIARSRIAEAHAGRSDIIAPDHATLYRRTPNERDVIIHVEFTDPETEMAGRSGRTLAEVDRGVIDVFATSVAIAFDHLEMQEQLRVANDTLEQRVEARTAEIRRTENRLRHLVEDAPVPLMVVARRSREVLSFNDKALMAFGLDPAAATGRRADGFWHRPGAYEAFLAAPDADGRLRDVETLLVRADGQVFPALASVTPTVFDDREVLVIGFSDISPLKERETQLRELAEERDRARREAEEGSGAKSRFLATMSHELRTPLNAILGFSEVIRDRRLGPARMDTYAQYAGYVHEAGSHLLALITDILDISKIEAGRLEISPVDLDLAQVLRSGQRLIEPAVQERRQILTLVMPDPVPPCHADERAIKQILYNLLSNASKFTPEGGRIELAARAVAEGWVLLTVTDSGIGIPADQIPLVLKPFEQIDNRYGRASGGTGLGLAMVEGLTRLHGGTLRIESRPGRGTRVSISLPPGPVS